MRHHAMPRCCNTTTHRAPAMRVALPRFRSIRGATRTGGWRWFSTRSAATRCGTWQIRQIRDCCSRAVGSPDPRRLRPVTPRSTIASLLGLVLVALAHAPVAQAAPIGASFVVEPPMADYVRELDPREQREHPRLGRAGHADPHRGDRGPAGRGDLPGAA